MKTRDPEIFYLCYFERRGNVLHYDFTVKNLNDWFKCGFTVTDTEIKHSRVDLREHRSEGCLATLWMHIRQVSPAAFHKAKVRGWLPDALVRFDEQVAKPANNPSS